MKRCFMRGRPNGWIPKVLVHKTRTAMVLFHAGRYDASIGYLHDILEFAPDSYLANLCLSGALCLAGRMDEASPSPAARRL